MYIVSVHINIVLLFRQFSFGRRTIVTAQCARVVANNDIKSRNAVVFTVDKVSYPIVNSTVESRDVRSRINDKSQTAVLYNYSAQNQLCDQVLQPPNGSVYDVLPP